MTRREGQLRRWADYADQAALDFADAGDIRSAEANHRLARQVAVLGLMRHTLQGVGAGLAIIGLSFVALLATVVLA